MIRLRLRLLSAFFLLFMCITHYSACSPRNSKIIEQSQQQNTNATAREANANTPVSSQSNTPQITFETISADEKRASFAGVSFVYGASLFPEVRAEIVPAHPLECEDCKPDSNYPQHIRFCFSNKESSKENYPFCYPELVIFKIEDFKQAFSIS